MSEKHDTMVSATKPTDAPPSYSTLEPPGYAMSTQPPTPLQLTPSSAKASACLTTIPTTSYLLTSGFPYTPLLSAHSVSATQWSLFNAELQHAAALSAGQKTLAVLGGISAAIVVAGPWAAPLYGRYVWQKQTVKNVEKGIAEGTQDTETAGVEESVGDVLAKWNAAWKQLGVEVGLEMPQWGCQSDTTAQGSTQCKGCAGCRGRGHCGGGCQNNRRCCHGRRCGGKGDCQHSQPCQGKSHYQLKRERKRFKVVIKVLEQGRVREVEEIEETEEEDVEKEEKDHFAEDS